MSKILILSSDVDSPIVAGPGMRYIELAQALSKKHEVSLVSHPGIEIADQNFHVINAPVYKEFNWGVKIKIPNPALKKILNQYDFMITKKEIFLAYGLPRIKGKIILDLYCPSFLENLEATRFHHKKFNREEINSFKKTMAHADFIICANESQRDLYLGLLLGARKFNVTKYHDDPSLRSFIDAVPTGIPSSPPLHTKKVLKGVVPAISGSDRVIIWWGGIWDWLDPENAIRAVAQTVGTRQDVRLVFFGIKHPNLPLTDTAQKAIRLSKELGVYEKAVFFIQRWVPYEERANYLLESDLGIICHQETLETHFSWRTRVLDYFWTDLPTISTDGDSLAELIKAHHLGKVVPPSSPEQLAQAIIRLLDSPEEYRQIKENIEKLKPSLYWENLISPIERFIHSQTGFKMSR